MWRSGLGNLGGIFLGGVLLVAAWAKMIHPQAFIETISHLGLDFLLPAAWVAWLGIGLEIALGVLLVFCVDRLWVLWSAAALTVFFIILNGREYWLDSQGLLDPADAGCGCFGNLVQRTPAEAFWQDLALLVPPLILAFWGRSLARGFPKLRTAAAAALTLAGVIFSMAAPNLPLDDLATRLKPDAEVAELCIGQDSDPAGRVCLTDVMPQLEEGRHVVILADIEDESFSSAIESINDYRSRSQGPELLVGTAAEPEKVHALIWRLGFEPKEVPEALLKTLHRRLPRSFLVEEGTVTRTFSGLPPFDELAVQPANVLVR